MRWIWFALGMLVVKLDKIMLLQAKGLCKTSENTLPQSTTASRLLGMASKVDLQEPSHTRDRLDSVDRLTSQTLVNTTRVNIRSTSRHFVWIGRNAQIFALGQAGSDRDHGSEAGFKSKALTVERVLSTVRLNGKRQIEIYMLSPDSVVIWHPFAPEPA